MKTRFFIVFILFPFLIKAQIENDSVLIRIQELNQLCAQADTLHHTWEENDIVDSVQNLIGDKLIRLLKSPSIQNYDLEKLIDDEFLSIIVSSDKKIQIFQWDENTGGTFRSSARIISYLDEKGNTNLVEVDSDVNYYISNGELWVSKVTKLKSPHNIYLIEESAATCGSCYAEYVRTVELTDSGLISYDGFYGDDNYGENDFKTNSFGIDYRWNESNSLVFNPDTQVIITSYFDGFSLDSARYFSDKLIFNGEMFVDPVMRKIALLRTLIDQYNNAGQNSDEINNLNAEVYNSLADLLLTNSSFESGIDYFLDAGPWEIIKSDDERILIYVWWEDQNATTNEYSGNIQLVVYRDDENQFHLLSGLYGAMEQRSKTFISEPMFNFSSVQKLKSDSLGVIYLFTGQQIGCIRCNNNYFAFTTLFRIDKDKNFKKIEYSPLITNNTNSDKEVNEFQFNKDNSELWYYEYIDGPAGKFEHIVRYRFNGNQFIRTDQ